MMAVMKEEMVVILFYKFINIADPDELRNQQKHLAERLGLKGRALIAEEGINATFEGPREAIEAYKKELQTDPRFSDVKFKESVGNGVAFPKLKIKVRPEIVTLGAGTFDVETETATNLPAEELERWYEENEDFVVLDLRNDYEIASGQFEKTIDPGLANFRDLPTKISDLGDLKNKKVVAVCTGGIRCEKATCLLRREGFKDIYQLQDGIHTYMAKFPSRHFKGTLFVFDNRMTTPVVEVTKRQVIGRCSFCDENTENYANDDSVRPSRKILCCDNCFENNKDRLRAAVEEKFVVPNLLL